MDLVKPQCVWEGNITSPFIYKWITHFQDMDGESRRNICHPNLALNVYTNMESNDSQLINKKTTSTFDY